MRDLMSLRLHDDAPRSEREAPWRVGDKRVVRLARQGLAILLDRSANRRLQHRNRPFRLRQQLARVLAVTGRMAGRGRNQRGMLAHVMGKRRVEILKACITLRHGDLDTPNETFKIQ